VVVLIVTHVGAAPGPSEATDSLVDELLTGHAEREAGELRWPSPSGRRLAWTPDPGPAGGHRLQGGAAITGLQARTA
jgi:hypothetical protein